jgi:HPt (histidine-containing phosphotransfer) domain-containing protein
MSGTTLKELTSTDDGESLDALLARTEGVVAALQGQFAEGTQVRIDRLSNLFRTGWPAVATRETAVREMRRIAHDLKGEAGTFGFDLITEIADLFGGYLRQTPVARQSREAVGGYIDTLTLVWNERIEGDGAGAGRVLLERMVRLTAVAV